MSPFSVVEGFDVFGCPRYGPRGNQTVLGALPKDLQTIFKELTRSSDGWHGIPDSTFTVHYTPTYASWLNQVEIWFNIITRQAVRSGSFRNVSELTERIQRYTAKWNANAHPFVWTVTVDSILAKIKRLCERIFATGLGTAPVCVSRHKL